MVKKRIAQRVMLLLLFIVGVDIAFAKEYSEQVTADFMQGCALTDEMREFCRCTIKEMFNFATEEEFIKIVDKAHAENEPKDLEELSLKAMNMCETLLD